MAAMKPLTRRRVRLALAIAMLADVVQLGLFPLFSEGAFAPANDVLDVIVAIVMFVLIGWHWAFLPTIVLELVPALNLVPTWTAAVLFVTRGSAVAPGSELAAVKQAGAAISSGAEAARQEGGGPASAYTQARGADDR
jgi:hypothetical protein